MSDQENTEATATGSKKRSTKAVIEDQSELANLKKEFNSQLDKILELVTKKLEIQKDYSDNKVLELKSDVKILNKRVEQLPLDGDITKLIKERDLNENTLLEITLDQTNGG